MHYDVIQMTFQWFQQELSKYADADENTDENVK